LLTEAGARFDLFLGQALFPTQAGKVSANQLAHVHAREDRRLHTFGLSTIICITDLGSETPEASLIESRNSSCANERWQTLNPTFTFYTCSTGCTDGEPRWRNDGISDVFFLNINDARRAAAELHREMSTDARSDPMTIRLEKIRTVPITDHAVLSLLNGDIASLIESYEIVETFCFGDGAPAPLPAR
jgi:hypothetical protein